MLRLRDVLSQFKAAAQTAFALTAVGLSSCKGVIWNFSRKISAIFLSLTTNIYIMESTQNHGRVTPSLAEQIPFHSVLNE